MKQNAIKTEKEMFAWLSEQVKLFRNARPRFRQYLRTMIQQARQYKNHPNRVELLQKYADVIDIHRSNPSYHSASFEGFFKVIGADFAKSQG